MIKAATIPPGLPRPSVLATAGLLHTKRSADFPVCGFWGLSSLSLNRIFAMACLGLLLTTTSISFAQATGDQTAIDEGLRRQAARISLREKLTAADSAWARGELKNAAKLYSEAWDIASQIGTDMPETQQAREGVATTHLELARAAMRRKDYRAADLELKLVLRVDPTNPIALDLKAENDKLLLEYRYKMPAPEVEA